METIIKIDVSKPANEQDGVIHNRWHPDIPMVTMVKPGDEFRVECLDWTGGQIKNDDNANDIRDVDFNPGTLPEWPHRCRGCRTR